MDDRELAKELDTHLYDHRTRNRDCVVCAVIVAHWASWRSAGDILFHEGSELLAVEKLRRVQALLDRFPDPEAGPLPGELRKAIGYWPQPQDYDPGLNRRQP